MSANVRDPFLSLVNNDCLDQYFDTDKERITQGIKLYQLFIDQYLIDEQQIIKFKNNLKNSLIMQLFSCLDDFSIYQHVVENKEYPYLDSRYTDIGNLLQLMDSRSKHFVYTTNDAYLQAAVNTSCKLLFVGSNDDVNEWNKICNKNFTFPPSVYQSSSPFKLTLVQIDGLAPSEIEILK